MSRTELFTETRDSQNLRLLKHSAELLELKINLESNYLESWHSTDSNNKILVHFIADVQMWLTEIDSKLLKSGKHIAICKNLTVTDELALLSIGFSAATKESAPPHYTLKAFSDVISNNLHFSQKTFSEYILKNRRISSPQKYYFLSESITKKEKEVLEQVCNGLSNDEVANTLSISINTVKMHLQNIYRKTKCKNRTQLLLAHANSEL
ncbi:response regulator transcription factor [Shewanella halifaxensis]|uniref:response regulator transcription factor n=1 Tax=Shewanella halifaxensis TaxID=271098 RepID=UPI000D591E47|nr:LuxR C-terminal-related transcriptional regulator [Shewanella halifaxensis]